MDINDSIISPLVLKVSFNKLLRHYEELAKSPEDFISAKARRVLKTAKPYPELREGFSNTQVLKDREREIEIILQDSFAPVLSQNEIKTASVPFHNMIFNASQRFKNIIATAGGNFSLNIDSMPENDRYIVACAIILDFCYGYNLNFKRPFYYEIPDAKGIMRYYKILYNADFCEIIPTDKAIKITEADYNELLDNFDNEALWKEKFPQGSYIFKGFVISNIFDVTDDQSISQIKSNLIGEDKRQDKDFMKKFQKIFRSLFGLDDIKVGFSVFQKDKSIFEKVTGVGITSYILNNNVVASCEDVLCSWSYNRLLNEQKIYAVSDIENNYAKDKSKPHINVLKEQGIGSAIFAPIANEKGVMGILEVVSKTPKVLNSISANKLVDVMPFIVSAVEQSKKVEENLIEAIIQQECTAIHSSVYWKFVDAAKQFLKDKAAAKKEAVFKKIVFEDVYPLFGQIDVKGSSNARNLATQKDLLLQLSLLEDIIRQVLEKEPIAVYEQLLFQIENYKSELKDNFKVDSEHSIGVFLRKEIEPVLLIFKERASSQLKGTINNYFSKIDKELNIIYHHRKNYDNAIMLINKSMAALLDEKQVNAQAMYPHFFERFKTDGVEHNMYVGQTIAKDYKFSPIYLYNLRLWQLQVMCEMENEFYNNQHLYPIKLDVASMILVFNQPLSIRFRMDEKQFDVDGTYNARYEVVKKRVDKAFIKNTKERITQNGKLTIVYSQKQDEEEYLDYIEFLQHKNVLDEKVEVLEVEDLQGVTGLKALRVDILYKGKEDDKTFYTYDDLMRELN